jgi:glycosyltransferase involved in cell wall biosynthesis
MRILMISPQPFFESRGAPFCVYQHVRALVALGYEVDLVTYHIGQDIALPGLRIFRAPTIPFIRGVKPGPSLAKFPLDLMVFLTAFWRFCLRRYKFIHAHEEAGVMGAILTRLFGGRHLYYMHSDLSQVVASSEFTRSRLLMHCVSAVQRFMLRKADGVIAFYPEIVEQAKRLAPEKPVYMILPPAVDEELAQASQEEVTRLRQELKLSDGPVLLYTGTLESYQGMDLLLGSIPAIRASFPTAHFVIAGGRPEQVEKLRLLAGELDVIETVRFVGQRPLEEMPGYMALADILVSTRSKGTHTPLKLYTYLRSGKPILATNILAHTQILTPELALLVAPDSAALANGAIHLLSNPKQASVLGKRAQSVWQEQYSWSAFLEKNREVYGEFMGVPQSANWSVTANEKDSISAGVGAR